MHHGRLLLADQKLCRNAPGVTEHIVGGPRRHRSVCAWFFHFPFLSRGSHYCGGQSRAGASTLSHTPGRTNRKTQWHVTILLAVLPQRRMHADHDNECIPMTTKAWTFRRQWQRRPSRPRPHALTINGSWIFIYYLIGYDLSDRQLSCFHPTIILPTLAVLHSCSMSLLLSIFWLLSFEQIKIWFDLNQHLCIPEHHGAIEIVLLLLYFFLPTSTLLLIYY